MKDLIKEIKEKMLKEIKEETDIIKQRDRVDTFRNFKQALATEPLVAFVGRNNLTD